MAGVVVGASGRARRDGRRRARLLAGLAILLIVATAFEGPGEGAADTTPATGIRGRPFTPDGGTGLVEGTSPLEPGTADRTNRRYRDDLAAIAAFRPAYRFWRHILAIPDGHIAFGSAIDGRLIGTLPVSGRSAAAQWMDPLLADVLDGQRLEAGLAGRRRQVAALLERIVGPVVHNPTRGSFLRPHASRYGGFIGEWGAIYERFGVPPDVGLAQAVLESGLNGRARSPAQALGLCQWLRRNWDRLDRLSPYVLEAFNQTTQAPYCAAYLSILATAYGSFIPALSEHHAGGANVGRTLINGERLGGAGTREQYLLGAEFARRLREISLPRYRALVRTYGPRSFLYAEMVFSNTITVDEIAASRPQERIYAMRTSRAIPLAEIVRRSGVPEAEVKRFNPALVRQVPARATVYLPSYVADFGPDVAFWHRPADPAYEAVLRDFVHLDAEGPVWPGAVDASFAEFQRRFAATATEEGAVMSTMLRYVLDDLRTSRRSAILDEFRSSRQIRDLFQLGVREAGAVPPRRSSSLE